MIRRLLAVASLALLAACGGASTSPTAAPATSTPTVSSTATAVATPTSAPTSAAGGDTVFAACTNTPPSGNAEPPPAHNGPVGACEAAQIMYPPSGGGCHPAGAGGSYRGACPVTDALATRLDAQPLSGPGGGADPVCRCQNTWQQVAYQVMGPAPNAPTTYTVRVALTFGPGSAENFDVIVFAVQSGSLVDDLQCAGGGTATSIKGASPGPCS